jgi:hypothetical protein
MPKPGASTAGNGARPPGIDKTHNTRASAKASSQASSRSQTNPPTPSRDDTPTAASPQKKDAVSGENKGEKHVVIRKEVLSAIANRLDEILEKCKTTEHFKKTLTSLARYTRNEAENDQGTVIQLTLADIRTIQDDVKTDLSKWCDTIEHKLDGLDSKQSRILEATASVSERASGLQAVAKELESQMGKVTVATDKIANNPTPYRDALTEGIGRTNRDLVEGRVLIDMERKAKQILIVIKDFDSAMITTDELKEKANGIIAKIKDRDRPETVLVETITRFANGSTLLQLNSKEAVKWLREPDIEDVFLKKIAKDAFVKERPHNVLLRGVPITYDPGNEHHLREIEEANGLVKYSILKSRWIKPENRRRRGQTHAHATAVIALATTANSLIKQGLNICGIRIWPEKLKQEPLQCLRCRRWGHFAVNCPDPEDTCGTCGEAHRTNLCNNPEKKFCVSCKSDAHTSWDRNCPEFSRRSRLLDEKHPENNMVYFPTDEEWTLTTRPNRIPLEERFPPRFTVNNIPITTKKPTKKGKRPMPTRPITAGNAQDKDQNTINQYFSRSQAKSKEKEAAQEEGELHDADEYDDCFDNIENNDIDRLIGSSSKPY